MSSGDTIRNEGTYQIQIRITCIYVILKLHKGLFDRHYPPSGFECQIFVWQILEKLKKPAQSNRQESAEQHVNQPIISILKRILHLHPVVKLHRLIHPHIFIMLDDTLWCFGHIVRSKFILRLGRGVGLDGLNIGGEMGRDEMLLVGWIFVWFDVVLMGGSDFFVHLDVGFFFLWLGGVLLAAGFLLIMQQFASIFMSLAI